jgi:ribosomal protein L9
MDLRRQLAAQKKGAETAARKYRRDEEEREEEEARRDEEMRQLAMARDVLEVSKQAGRQAGTLASLESQDSERVSVQQCMQACVFPLR